MTLRQLEEQYKNIPLEKSEEFISAIKSASTNQDISPLSLIAFLNKIIREFIPEGRRLCDMADKLSEQEEARIIVHGKILAAQMHILQSTRSYKDLILDTEETANIPFAQCCYFCNVNDTRNQ